MVGIVAALAVLGFVCLLSLAVGSRSIPLSTAVSAFTSYDPAIQDELIVRDVRGPRTIIGLMVGVALGLSGALMQGLTRNPIADPGLLGINAGASLAAAVAVLLLSVGGLYGYIWFAFIGAGITAVLVYTIASFGREGATPVKLALAGVAMTAVLTSMTSAIVLLDVQLLNALRFWLVGSIASRGAVIASQVWPFILAGVAMALVCGRLLNALSLGEDVARSLGQHVGRARMFAGGAAVILAGAATAAAGPIGFVGLTIPHFARAIAGPDYKWILPYSAVFGGILLLAADIVGRIIVRPEELEVGIVTAVVGAPLFIALVRRRKLVEL